MPRRGPHAAVPQPRPIRTGFFDPVLRLLGRIAGGLAAPADEREQRFRTLLGIAVDWYWEQDE